MELNWTIRSDTSAVYAALGACSLDDLSVDRGVVGFRQAALALGNTLSSPGDWKILLSNTVSADGAGQVIGGGFVSTETQAALESVCALYATGIADFSEQLRLRIGPLQQQWEAYGPGLIAAANLDDVATETLKQVRVCPVLPVIGGGGVLLTNQVVIEAVLANANPLLPEILRLAWLLAASVRPAYEAEDPKVGIANVLRVAEEMGLTARIEEATIQAIEDWLRLDTLTR